jgi:hypothetical protein
MYAGLEPLKSPAARPSFGTLNRNAANGGIELRENATVFLGEVHKLLFLLPFHQNA